MGVRLMNLAAGDSVVAVARNAEAGPGTVADDEADDEADGEGENGAADGLAEPGPAAGTSAGAGDVATGQPQDG
jgi:hypothetical protein